MTFFYSAFYFNKTLTITVTRFFTAKKPEIFVDVSWSYLGTNGAVENPDVLEGKTKGFQGSETFLKLVQT